MFSTALAIVSIFGKKTVTIRFDKMVKKECFLKHYIKKNKESVEKTPKLSKTFSTVNEGIMKNKYKKNVYIIYLQ
jgi:hypothetical protein